MSLSKEIINRTLATSNGEQAYRVCETLLDAGYEAWWVGGCVRDMMLEQIPADIDIATNALPHQVTQLFDKYDDSACALGAVIVSLLGHTYEVTTYRKEHELSDGRFPASVEFTDKQYDTQRRDITINAMYWNPISSELYDPFEGEKDLHEKLIRCIGEPDTRIRHDALRMLRIIRFRAAIDGQYHPDTFGALHKNAKLITVLSGERRYRELEKMLMGPQPHIAFEDLWETDILEYLMPELHACKGVAQPSTAHEEGDVWDHTMRVAASFTQDHGSDTRWAALLHDIGKPVTFSIDEQRIRFNEHASIGGKIAKELLTGLGFPAKRRDKICWLIEHHMMMGTFFDISEDRKHHWYYHPWFIELLQVFWLDIAGTAPSNFSMYEKIIEDYSRFLDKNPSPKKPLLTGDEIMEELGIREGRQIGEILKALHREQNAKRISTKKEALEFIRCQKKS